MLVANLLAVSLSTVVFSIALMQEENHTLGTPESFVRFTRVSQSMRFITGVVAHSQEMGKHAESAIAGFLGSTVI